MCISKPTGQGKICLETGLWSGMPETGYSLVSFSGYEPPRGKTNNVVSEHVRHIPTCIVTEKS